MNTFSETSPLRSLVRVPLLAHFIVTGFFAPCCPAHMPCSEYRAKGWVESSLLRTARVSCAVPSPGFGGQVGALHMSLRLSIRDLLGWAVSPKDLNISSHRCQPVVAREDVFPALKGVIGSVGHHPSRFELSTQKVNIIQAMNTFSETSPLRSLVRASLPAHFIAAGFFAPCCPAHMPCSEYRTKGWVASEDVFTT